MMKLFDKKSHKQNDAKSSSSPAAAVLVAAVSPKSKKKRTRRKKTTAVPAASSTTCSADVKQKEREAAAVTTKDDDDDAAASSPLPVVVDQVSVVSSNGGGGSRGEGSSSVSIASGVIRQNDVHIATASRPTSPISNVSVSNQELSSDDDKQDDVDDIGDRPSPRLQLSDIQESVDDNEEEDDDDSDNNGDDKSANTKQPIIKLYKSSRLKAYMTLTFASGICWSSAVSSTNTINVTVVPATESQRKYAMAVSILSMCIVGPILTVHFDSFSPLQRFWIAAFAPGSRIELSLALFLMLWWSVAVVVQTSISGVAGDGKGQVSLYFSSWVCCWAGYWIFERWWVAAGYSSFKSFITSWPYRAPGWICIFVTGIFTLVWYTDLKKNYGTLADRKSEAILYLYFSSIADWQWRLLIALVVLTILPAIIFVVAEIARKTKPDGSTGDKFRPEIIAEGVILFILIVAWIPTIMLATTSGGAASQVGNAYFFSWILVVFIAETSVWFVHDLRSDMHASLRRRTEEYHQQQAQVLAQTRAIQTQKVKQQKRAQKQAAARQRANSSGGSSMSGHANQHEHENNNNDDSESQYDDADDDDGDFSDFDRQQIGSTEFFEAVP